MNVRYQARSGLRYEPALDGLRGVSVAGVLAYHACAASGLTGWFRGGFVGVSVFFTLSGYLITSLLLTEHDRTGRVDVARFVSRRIRRLSPALFVVILAVVALSALDVLAVKPSDVAAATWSFTNWHVIAGGESQLLRTIVGPLGPTWSLAVEEQLYAVLVVGVLVALRSLRRDLVLLAGAAAVAIASVLVANVASNWNPRLEFGTDVRAAEVAIGVALAVLVRTTGLARISEREGSFVAAGGLVVIGLVFLLVDLTPPWLLRGGYLAVALVSAATIVGLVTGGRARELMSYPAAVSLGRISYSLYLVHWPVISVLTVDRAGFDGLPLAALQSLCSIGTAAAIYRFVERPIREMPPTDIAPTLGAHAVAGLAITALAIVVL